MMVAGECYMQMSDYDRAMNEFQSAMALAPDSADTNYNLAVMYGQAKEMGQAERYLRRALELRETHVSAIGSLAGILSESNDTARQQEAFAWWVWLCGCGLLSNEVSPIPTLSLCLPPPSLFVSIKLKV